MARFYPLFIRRSDGKIEVKDRHKQLERNEPTEEQLDRRPDAAGMCDFYREVGVEEQKHLDWRRKLAGMLAKDLGHSDPDKGFILAAFPENYRLYEHVKKSADESKAKSVKTHAGGGNERQDAYLYGHPTGRKKRYRSPADFYLHLYWLATDEEGDPDNCACKMCCPEEIDEKLLNPPKTEPATADVVDTKSASATKTSTAAAPTTQKVPKVQRTPSQSSVTSTQTVQSQPNPRAESGPVINDTQRKDLAPDSQLFRQGELVWFDRGDAWGLGVLKQRDRSNTISTYIVQPLSHPFSHPGVLQVGDHQLRPWLAWSVPDYMHQGLNVSDMTYWTADWEGIRAGRYGQGELEVDASIMAAKAIDLSYTPTDKASSHARADGVIETSYHGLYLGAERVWKGDILRLNSNNGTDIMVISNIIEQSASPQAPPQQVVIRGDIWSLRQSSGSAGHPNLSQLPIRLANDLMRRNASTLAVRGFTSTYIRAATEANIDLSAIRGRWYAAEKLGPVLLGVEATEQALAHAELGEMGTRLNSRLNCQKRGADGSMPAQVRCASRVGALGNAVPKGFQII